MPRFLAPRPAIPGRVPGHLLRFPHRRSPAARSRALVRSLCNASDFERIPYARPRVPPRPDSAHGDPNCPHRDGEAFQRLPRPGGVPAPSTAVRCPIARREPPVAAQTRSWVRPAPARHAQSRRPGSRTHSQVRLGGSGVLTAAGHFGHGLAAQPAFKLDPSPGAGYGHDIETCSTAAGAMHCTRGEVGHPRSIASLGERSRIGRSRHGGKRRRGPR